MALSFFSNFTAEKRDESLTLLVDIGSASVGAALVSIEKGRAPHVVASIRENISFQEVLSSQHFMAAMNHALDQVLKNIQSKTKTTGNPQHIFCTLSSPWFILKTRNISVVREEEFEITDRVVDEFINADIELLKEELKGTLPPKDVRIIEKKIIQMKLNGYEIKNPFGQKTSRIELSSTIGVSSAKVIESIERKLKGFFHAKSTHFGAFPLAAFSAVRDIFPIEKNFLFLDITGEATDVSLVNNDILMGTISFPCGKNFFIREMSTQLRTIHEEAATLFAMFIRDELDTARRATIQDIITRAESEWLIRFKKAINTLSKNGALSRKVFFTIDADIAPLFFRLVTTAKSELLFGQKFDAQYLDQLIVAKFVSFEPEVTRDPFIVVEALLTLKLVEQHT